MIFLFHFAVKDQPKYVHQTGGDAHQKYKNQDGLSGQHRKLKETGHKQQTDQHGCDRDRKHGYSKLGKGGRYMIKRNKSDGCQDPKRHRLQMSNRQMKQFGTKHCQKHQNHIGQTACHSPSDYISHKFSTYNGVIGLQCQEKRGNSDGQGADQ